MLSRIEEYSKKKGKEITSLTLIHHFKPYIVRFLSVFWIIFFKVINVKSGEKNKLKALNYLNPTLYKNLSRYLKYNDRNQGKLSPDDVKQLIKISQPETITMGDGKKFL